MVRFRGGATIFKIFGYKVNQRHIYYYMKLRHINTTSLQGFKYPVCGQDSWAMINDECKNVRRFHV